jgi:starch synthase
MNGNARQLSEAFFTNAWLPHDTRTAIKPRSFFTFKYAETNPVVRRIVDEQKFSNDSLMTDLAGKITYGHKKNILFVTSELTGLVKSGGLGDVSAALPRALNQEHDVRVLIPGYPQVMKSGLPITKICHLDSFVCLPECDIGRMELEDGLIVYVVICPELYQRQGTPYLDEKGEPWQDNYLRFARLGLAAAEIAMAENLFEWNPDLVHANDWQAGLAPAYMKWRGLKIPSVFTIHNIEFQGLFNSEFIYELGIPESALNDEQLQLHGDLSFLKAGIVYADHITTVSETYASEILGEEISCGLHNTLQLKADQGRLSGFTNGIDATWRSHSDTALVKNFHVGDWQGKQENAEYLGKIYQLEQSNGPIFASISRVTLQKGIDFTIAIAAHIVNLSGRFIFMGCGDADLENQLKSLAESYPGKIAVEINYDEDRARQIFAGSDFFLMPSRVEPCGLTQMYAQRFASLPIAHAVGGLAETIEDGLSGILFHHLDQHQYQAAITRAFNIYQRVELLNAMRAYAMNCPLDWAQAAVPYSRLYAELINEKRVSPTLVSAMAGV